MKLPEPFIQLPLQYDAGRLCEEVAALGDDAWKPHPMGYPGNSMLPLIAVRGDPSDEGFSGPMRPTPELRRCPYLVQVLGSFGATLGRTRLMRLAGHAEVTPHVDQGYYWVDRMRVHVPVLTQPTVRFECGDAAVHMAAGECWIFDTWREHRVLNDSGDMRIHLVADTVGGDRFWGYVARGRSNPSDRGPWKAERLEFTEGRPVELPCETVNVPKVMSPWEMGAQFGLLFGDAEQHPQLAVVAQMTSHFLRIWKSLWMRYGESGEGAAEYRRELARYVEAVRVPGQPLNLKNGIGWYSAMMMIVAKPALREESAGSVGNEYGVEDNA